jgi:hypothetical protein
MRLFERLFHIVGGKNTPQPDISFGRYTDAYKTAEQQRDWERSLQLFDEGQFVEAYRHFLQYLRNDTGNNITWQESEAGLEFEFWQGSQRISGTADAERVKAESRIARASDLNVSFLRRMIEYNFSLRFCRFALSPENHLTLLFDTYTLDGSPYKLLHALRELALHADKQDDLLLDEFPSLGPVEERTFGEVAETEKEVKYAYMTREIEAAFAEIEAGTPNPNLYPGSYCYLLLGLAFKLDYLIRPEGFMMDVLERVYGIYFGKNDRNTQQKLQSIRRELQKLLDRPKEDFFKEIYRTRSTFGANPAINHGSVSSLIDGELPHLEWSLQQNFTTLALAVPQYIVGLLLFQGSPPQPDREFFHLFYRITEEPFFRELGFPQKFLDDNGRLQRSVILREVKRLEERYLAEFPQLDPDKEGLDFGSLTLFAKSYLIMIKNLNLTKVE